MKGLGKVCETERIYQKAANMLRFCCLLCTCFGLLAGCDQQQQLNGILGKSVTFNTIDLKVGYQSLTLRSTNESFNQRQILVTYDPTSKKETFSLDRRYKFSKEDSTFQILELHRSDDGTYEISTTDHGGGEKMCKYDLKVYEEITNLALQATFISQNGSCVLTCALQTGDWVTFHWSRDREDLNHSSSTLVVHVSPENSTSEYTCQVENPVSIGTLTLTDACRATPDPDVTNVFVYAAVGLAGLAGLLLVMAAIIGIQKVTKRRKGRFLIGPASPPERPPALEPISEPEICTVYATIQKKESVNNGCTVYELAGPCAAQP